MKGLLLGLALAVSLVPATLQAQSAPPPCQFILGFKALHELDPGDVGDCVDDQGFQPNGDALQHTTKGLMAWRKVDNWTAFTNGAVTWINGPDGLASRPNSDRFPWESPAPDLNLAAAPPIATPSAPTATAAQPAPTPQLVYSWYYKRVTEGVQLCGKGQAFACVDSAPNAGTQYIGGHVMDKSGNPVAGIIVASSVNGKVTYSSPTGTDGLFSVLIATTCPADTRNYSLYIVDGSYRTSSYVKNITYTNCATAGEFHFDFIQAS